MGKYIQNISCMFESKEFVQEWGTTPIGFIFEMFQEKVREKKIEGNGIAKILITFTLESNLDKNITDFIDVIEIKSYVNISEVKSLKEKEKHSFILNKILDCLKKFSEERQMNIEQFKQVYDEIVFANIVFSGQVGKKVLSPNKKNKAFIKFKYEEKIEATLCFEDSDKNIKFGEFRTSFHGFKEIANKLEWLDDNLIKIWNKNKKDYWSYSLSEDKLEFYFERAEKGDAHGEYDLGMMYLEGRCVFADKEKAIYWLKKSALQNYVKAKKMLEKI